MFTDVLKREGIAISIDGRGRALNNIFVERLWHSVKYEEVYLKGYGTITELPPWPGGIFRVLQRRVPAPVALDNRMPNTVYADG